MIQDYQTNKVYLAQGLRHFESVCKNMLEALNREQIETEFLPFTSSPKHIWARDYMPLQIEESQFYYYKYYPDYLKGYDGYIPNIRDIIDYYNLGCIPMDIILDGGNVVACGDKVIMTDKIFKENDMMERRKLIDTLESFLKSQIVLIPWDRYEIYGHSDGMVRWIDGNRVLMNNYAQIDPHLRKRMLTALSPHFVVDELEYNTHRLGKHSWAYLNFLRVNNHIFVPGLHAMEDQQALEQIRLFYPDCEVIQIQGCEELARNGGALHCISWNILVDELTNANCI